MITKTSCDYITNRAWFRNVIGTGRHDIILCHVSALECLQLFNGYLNEKSIDVYVKEKGIYENINYRVVNNFNNIDTVNAGGLLCTSVNQTINDMLKDFDNTDEQALVEALNEYYYSKNKSFKGLSIDPENMQNFDYIKYWAIEYHNKGVKNDKARKIHV